MGNIEAVGVRQLNVEQDQIRASALDLHKGRGAVLGLPHDFEPFGLEKGSGDRPELLVIVDDEHALSHARMVAQSHAAHPQGEP